MEIGRIERRKIFLRTLLSLAICLSLLLTVKAFADDTINETKIIFSDPSLSENLHATYKGVRATKGYYAGHNGTVDVVDNEVKSFTATVKSAHINKLYAQTYPESNMTITLKNRYDTPAILSFTYNIVSAYGTVTGDAIKGSTGSFEKEIPGGGDITIKIVSSDKKAGYESGVVFELTNLSLKQVEITATTTFIPGEHGSYTVNGKAVDGEISHTQKSTDKYNLNAQADDGYIFLGWRNLTAKRYLSTNNPESIGIASDCTIQPVFIPEDSAQFRVGDQVFYDLNEANKYALTQSTKTIVLVKSGAIPVDQYKIDSGVTLLIPYSDSTEVHTTKPSNSNTEDIKTNRSAYRTLTVPSGTTINVYGALNVDGQISKNKSLPTGQYGLITLESGAKINLSGKDEKGNDKGGSLYCWGYINGDGLVIANSGANVYESFQLTGWRGGGASQTIVGDAGKKRVFPINQYYIQNVEAALQFHYGAKEYVYASVEVTIPLIGKQQYDVTTEFISTNAGMFRLQSGCTFTKKYIPATDRMLYEVDGDFTIGTMALNFTTIISLKTEQYDLPINSNFSVDIRSGTTTIAPNQNIALLPGAKFTVSHGAEFVAESNMYVYDRDEWIGKNYAYDGGDLRVVGYSTTNGTTTMRTDADLVDATIDVNGKLRIRGTKGGIYTTKNPNDPDRGSANIFSSEGTGQVIFDIATKDEATAYQVRQKGNDVEGYDEIPCDSAQLRNGNGTYTTTAGAQAGWTYKYDTVQQRWYRFRVNYQFNGKDIGYDLITTDTAERDVSNYVSDNSSLVGTVTSGKANTPTISGGTLKVTGVGSDCTINIEGVAASYTPKFVLNEHQYSVYLSYGGTEITNTVQENHKTYYVVQDCGTMKFGAELSAPSADTMGVSDANHNSITWFLEDVTTGAQQFMNTVPSGKNKGEPVYIYGIYTGAVAYNSYTDKYYTNLKDAIVDLPVTGSATLTMYANCGTFEDESKTASYSLSANITFDVNGKEAWGSLVNNGTLTLVDAKGGKIITEAVSTNGSLQNYASVVRNNGTLTMDGVTLVGTQTTNDYFAGVMNYTGGEIVSMKDCNVSVQRGYGVFNYGGTIDTIDGGSITGKYGIFNRNYRTVSVSNGVAPQLGAVARIGTIQNTNVTATTQYALWNGGTIGTICGNAEFHNTGSDNHIVYNSNSWFYDSYVASRTDSTSNGYVRTDTYITDDACIPTIGTITGNVVISSDTCGYGLSNYGNIGTISGNVQIAAKRYALGVYEGGKINSINGDGITIKATAGERGVSVSGQRTAKTVITYLNAVGDTATKIETTYGRASSIGTITGNVEISATGYDKDGKAIGNYGMINYGTIDAITGSGVKIQANGVYALLNGEGGRVLTQIETRTNLGQIDKVTADHYLTLCEYERTYNEQGPYIGTIDGITVVSTGGNGINNQGTIDEVKDANATASSNAVSNSNGHFIQRKTFALKHDAKAYGVSSAYIGEQSISYTRKQSEIDKLTGVTATTTSSDGALSNTGTINTIDGCTFTAQTHNALSNSLCATGYYLGDHASVYEQYKEFISEESSYVFRATDSTSEYTRGNIGSITNTTITSNRITNGSVAVVNNSGYIGTIGEGTTVKLMNTSRTDQNLHAISVSDNCYTARRTIYKDVTDAIKSLGTPTNGVYYRQDEYINTYTDGICAEIGTIVGATISNEFGYGITNYGKIGSIKQGTNISSYQYGVYNYNGSYTVRNSARLYTGKTAYATNVSEIIAEWSAINTYAKTPAEINLIDGATIETTGTGYGIGNAGHIGTIQNTKVTTKSAYAIWNAGKTNLTYKVEYEGNGVEGISPYIVWDTSKTKYVFATAYSSTNSYSATCTPCVIDLIGEGNTLTSKNYTIFNSGIITEINGGTSKNTVSATGTSGVGINNYRGTNATEKVVAGSGTYTYNSATIGTIANTEVTATVNALVNSDGSSNYTAVAISELGTGNMFESGKDCVVNNNNGSIATITGGTFTATSTDTYALKNNNTSAAIAISVGPTFLGGTDSRSYAIYEADTRQTYPEGGYTLSYKPNDDGYYYIAENKFTIYYRGNGSASEPVSGKEFSQTVTLPTTNVVITANQPFTRSNWTFVGWALDANTGADSTALLTRGQTVTRDKLGNPGAGDEVTLYAIWKPNKTYTVTVGWSGDLVYNYQPNVYEWNAQNLCYVLKTPAYWDGDHIVTITNAEGHSGNTKYGKVNVGISYTNTNASYSGFSMKYYNPDTQVEFTGTDSNNNLAKALDPGGIVKAQMKLIGDLPTGMASGTNIKIGRVALTLTTAD